MVDSGADEGSDATLGTRLGRVGVWIGGYGPPAKVDLDIVGEIEALGFGAFWFGEAPGGREPFVRATMLLAGTERIVVATGIASIWARDATAMSAASRTIGEAFPGRFVLGMGVSHPPAVAMRGSSYRQPLTFMRSYLEQMGSLDEPSPAPAQRGADGDRRTAAEDARTGGPQRPTGPTRTSSRSSTRDGPAGSSDRPACSRPNWPSCSSAIRSRPGGWPGSTRRASTSGHRTTSRTSAGWASPTTTWSTADPTRWSMRSLRGATTRRSGGGSASTSTREPITCASSPSRTGASVTPIEVLRRLAPALSDA